jgi:general secretion pathway protein C
MVTSFRDKWILRTSTLMVWTLAGACAVFWGLKLSAPGHGQVVAPVAWAGPAAVDAAAVARLLGAPQGMAVAAPAAAVPSRFALQGVLAGRQSGGAALIAVDGKPARPVRVGAVVEEGLVLQSVQGRKALLGADRDGPASVTLEMAPLSR